MNTLNTIFEHHDALSHDAVFAETAQDRERAYIKAEALRELITAIKDTLPAKEQERFTDAAKAHFNAIGKGIFYKRNLDFER